MRLLIVEDDKEIRSYLKSALEAEQFVVDTAEDGEKGAYLGKMNEYDLIILDNILPKKLGNEVCAEIRKKGKAPPIIILTVQSDVQQKVEMFNAGADDYLTKPFSFEELRARIQALLRRGKNVSEPILKIADLSLDTNKKQVTRKDTDIYLTRKEFELLEYMLQNQGRVLSRAMIMEHVWDMNADPFSNTIETHILHLRRKIDAGFDQKLIHTIPGRGYKVDLKK